MQGKSWKSPCGPEKAVSIINRLTSSLQIRPFDFAAQDGSVTALKLYSKRTSPDDCPDNGVSDAGTVRCYYFQFTGGSAGEVSKRIALMDRTSPDVLKDVERVLERKLSSLATQDFTTAGGVDAIVEMLNRVDRTTERTIIENLEVQNPELAEEIKRKMFVFEDIVMLDDRSLQMVLREIDQKDLALALKASSGEVGEKSTRICRNGLLKCCVRKLNIWDLYVFAM